MKFFFDNCFSINIVNAVRCLEHRRDLVLVHSTERFPADTKDPVWIGALAKDGDWIVISGDPRISRGKAERAAWIESGLTAFFCGDAWGSRRLFFQASEFLRWWVHITEQGKVAARGAGYMLEFKSKEPIQIYPESSRNRKKDR